MNNALTRPTDHWIADGRYKGFPSHAEGIRAAEVSALGWTLRQDFSTPIATIDLAAVTHNIRLMQRFCALQRVELAPHAKTTMSPELVRMQLEAGAWGMTVATAWQAKTVIGFGARRVIIANECVDPPSLRWIAEMHGREDSAEILVFVDSLESVALMERVLTEIAQETFRLPVILEVGFDGGRAGVRSDEGVLAVAAAVSASPVLELAGVGGFEGIIDAEADGLDTVAGFVRRMRDVARAVERERLFRPSGPLILTAGGSAYFDVVARELRGAEDDLRRPVEVVLRSGCYIAHDDGVYAQVSPPRSEDETSFRSAVSVWSTVIAVPEPGLAIIDAGKRDISTERPVVLLAIARADTAIAPGGALVTRFNDQHGYVDVPPGVELRVGDRVRLGGSHPCITFDKWRAMAVVDGGDEVVGVIRTEF